MKPPDPPDPDPAPAWARDIGLRAFPLFMDLVVAALDRRGRPYRLEGDVVHIDGSRMGLHTLAQRCQGQPPDDWPEMIGRHFAVLLDRDDDAETAVLADFDRAAPILKVRLYAEDAVGASDVALVTRPFAPGLVAALTCDFPQTVRSVHPDDAARWPVGTDQLFDIGYGNVWEQDQPEVGRVPLSDGVEVTMLAGESFFTATHVAWLDRHMDLPADGALVGIPHRHVVLAYPLRDASVIAAVTDLMGCLDGMHRQGPGSLTPTLLWWRDGVLTRLDAEVTDRTLTFRPSPEFVAVLERIIT
jgi:hypothetical protein